MLVDRYLLTVTIRVLSWHLRAQRMNRGKGWECEETECEETLAGEEDHSEEGTAADLNLP